MLSRRRERAGVVLSWVRTALRFGLAGIFVVAGALKVLDLDASVQAVQAYALLPGWLEHLIGWVLPFAEIAIGLLFAAGLFTRVVAIVASALLVVFVIAVITAIARGLPIDCGCFGGGGLVAPGQTAYTSEMIRDLLFLAAALWLVGQPQTRLSWDRTGSTTFGDPSDVVRRP